MEKNHSNFKKCLDMIDVKLNDNQLDQFDIYYDKLVEWNSFMNLTGITEYEEVIF